MATSTPKLTSHVLVTMHYTPHTASAPGKLFVFGEYAVLACAPCVVLSVGRRVVASAHATPQPAYVTRGAALAEDTRLPDMALTELNDARSAAWFSTDVSALYDGDIKLGLGSSAASMAALMLAAKRLPADELFAHAWRAHRALQSGRGSGADVAASCYGGVLGYQLLEPQAPFPQLDLPPMKHSRDVGGVAGIRDGLSFPDDLTLHAVWLGAPATSTELIRRVEQALQTNPEATRDALQRVAVVADDALHAMGTGDSAALLRAFGEGEGAMRALGVAAGAPIITPAHHALSELAAKHGGRAKPSGAGGGDISWMVLPGDADPRRVLDRLPEGCRHVPLELFVSGARVHEP